MMRSLYSGVTGLKTHQIKMDVIGNNIANVNTTSYKSQSVTFSELMYQTTQTASGANESTGRAGVNARQVGLGVKSGATKINIETAGSSQTTGNPFDIRITGDSFFIVSDGLKNFFTRDGSFYVDGAGNLAMSSNGYNVMGWGVDPTTGGIRKDTVQPLQVMSAENMTYPPEATTEAYISGIIDKNDPQVSSEAGRIASISLYDNRGYAYSAKLSFKATGNEGEYTVELADLLDSAGNSVKTDDIKIGSVQRLENPRTLELANGYRVQGTTLYYTDDAGVEQPINLNDPNMSASDKAKVASAYGYATFEEFGKNYILDGTDPKPLSQLLADGNLASAIDAATGNINSQGRQIVGGVIQYNPATGAIQSVNGLTNNLSLTLSFGNDPDAAFMDINVDFSPSSNYNNNKVSTIGAVSGDVNGKGTGRRIGEMSGISVQNDGMIYAAYDNGQTKLLGQIAVAKFANASGLSKEGDNLYTSTMNSGEFDGIGIDITADGGYMTTGVLEMSNVDLSAEFTEMITTQRGFQANSRIITVSDTLLEELVNLKR
ncbi:MAG: flagellar hook-basal body complex protein [Lachnospiraceae bacterium]|nr:flagellar hook-basal body complex protein [Lachnospiraceae bacterium]